MYIFSHGVILGQFYAGEVGVAEMRRGGSNVSVTLGKAGGHHLASTPASLSAISWTILFDLTYYHICIIIIITHLFVGVVSRYVCMYVCYPVLPHVFRRKCP